MPHVPDPVAHLLARQHGVAARKQILALDDVGEDRLEWWARSGFLETVHRGVYRVRGGASSPEQDAMAAALRAREGARITGSLVLGLLNVEGFGRSDPFEVLVPGRRRVENVPFSVRRAHVPRSHHATIDGVPAVTPARALIDSARRVEDKRLMAGLDAARWLGLTDPVRVRRCAETLGRRDVGAARVLDLLDDGATEQESQGERAMAVALADLEPQPEWGVWVTPHRRADALWRDVLLILEYLGERHHGSAPHRSDDRVRDEELRAAGYDIAYVTARDLGDPDSLIARLTSHREHRRRELHGATDGGP